MPTHKYIHVDVDTYIVYTVYIHILFGIYIHTYIHACMHACIHTFKQTDTHVSIYIHYTQLLHIHT